MALRTHQGTSGRGGFGAERPALANEYFVINEVVRQVLDPV